MRTRNFWTETMMWLIAGCISLTVAFVSWYLWAGVLVPPRPRLREEAYEAYKAQMQNDWCTAQAKWESVRQGASRLHDSVVLMEAERNLEIVSPLCRNPIGTPEPPKLKPLPEDRRPAKVSED